MKTILLRLINDNTKGWKNKKHRSLKRLSLTCFVSAFVFFASFLSEKSYAANDCVQSVGPTTTTGGVSVVCLGANVTFNATATANINQSRVTFSYQLYRNGVAISGATGSQGTSGTAQNLSLSITYAATTTGTYTIVVTSNVCNGNSGTSTLGVTV